MWMWLGQHCSVIKFYDDKYYGKLIWHYINVVLKNDHYHVQLNSYWGFSASKRSTAKPCIQVLPSTMPRTLVIRCQCLWMGNWGHKKPCETQMVDNHWYKAPLTTQVFTQSEGHETEDLFILNAHWGFVPNTGRHCNTRIRFPNIDPCVAVHTCVCVCVVVLTRLYIKEKERDWDCLSLSECSSVCLSLFLNDRQKSCSWIVGSSRLC